MLTAYIIWHVPQYNMVMWVRRVRNLISFMEARKWAPMALGM